ncbi:slipin family protein [Sporomusa acidovorans]|uniref:Band 7 domain-containing protein n=1 Tax=Sporomusa acidovorans (strain ATCC 49682 / DSM 3132 / Mol) TaxID=1123286 RepID=A0ABZ3JAS0_SPOA4|nr:slipin family protein [Sporomusa acidovorans]OZC22726.1 FtsH protease regulator HflK [Sporomusa acidovorans DSM 3132]SDE79926.1 SPFH domain / Band 7 family protein [Sporomusa acidovorans]
MRITIKDHERGLLFKDGNYKEVLKPGKHFILPFSETKIEILDITKPFYVEGYDIDIFLKDENLCKELDVINIGDQELVFHFIDEKFQEVIGTGKYAFWNILKKHTFNIVDVSNPEIAVHIDRNLLARPQLRAYSAIYDIEPYMKGVLYFDNKMQRLLEPGRHYFWLGSNKVDIVKVDMRKREIEINGQEMMTEDKVPLRFNFVCQYRITDAVKVVMDVKDYEQQIYVLLQLVLREYVGTLKLDDLLKMKQEIAAYVLKVLKEKEQDYGAEFLFAGVKDIILPGEIKDILNTVLIAEKKALANVITRREETASTRSLLNTAKLMDENHTLFRLKELEFLEKICDKIGSISLNGGGLLEQLNSLLAVKR